MRDYSSFCFVSKELTKAAGGVSQTIVDPSVTDVWITLSVSSLGVGDNQEAKVCLTVYVTPNKGFLNEIGTVIFRGHTRNEYRRAIQIANLAKYGSAPWTITVKRITQDNENHTHWDFYTEWKGETDGTTAMS
jgi:hypothetical protein